MVISFGMSQCFGEIDNFFICFDLRTTLTLGGKIVKMAPWRYKLVCCPKQNPYFNLTKFFCFVIIETGNKTG